MNIVRPLIALLICLLGPLLTACTAAEASPIVYTAPPEVLDARTFSTPTPTPSAVPAASVAPPSSDQATSAPSGSRAVGEPDPGQIVFGTGAGPDLCSVENPSSVLPATGPFF